MKINIGTRTKSLSNGAKKFASGFKSILTQRNELFFISCTYSMFTDPLFLYTPVINDDKKCFKLDNSLEYLAIVVLVILAGTQRMRGRKFFSAMNFFFMQHVLKIIRFYTLVEKAKTSDKLTGWAKLTFNLSFSHAAHAIGASYYFFALKRKTECWRKACTSHTGCDQVPFYCDNKLGNYTFSNDFCSTNTTNNLTTYDFGIFKDAIQIGVVEETNFFKRFFASFRWSLQILSSFGQGLPLSTNIWENIFVMCITITGVFLFFFLIAKVQSEMSKSAETRHNIEEEIDRWQPFAKLPKILQNQVKKHQSSFKRRETYRGVDVESLLSNLPEYLIKNIKQELCLDLLKNVDEFKNWRARLLKELCDAVKPALVTDRSYIVREGDAIDRMLFVLQGELWSYTRSSNSSSSANSMNKNNIKDCCGEELVAWYKADPQDSSSSNDRLPISTRTIQAVTNVEAFVVMADDLKKIMIIRQNMAARIVQLFWRARRIPQHAVTVSEDSLAIQSRCCNHSLIFCG